MGGAQAGAGEREWECTSILVESLRRLPSSLRIDDRAQPARPPAVEPGRLESALRGHRVLLRSLKGEVSQKRESDKDK